MLKHQPGAAPPDPSNPRHAWASSLFNARAGPVAKTAPATPTPGKPLRASPGIRIAWATPPRCALNRSYAPGPVPRPNRPTRPLGRHPGALLSLLGLSKRQGTPSKNRLKPFLSRFNLRGYNYPSHALKHPPGAFMGLIGGVLSKRTTR